MISSNPVCGHGVACLWDHDRLLYHVTDSGIVVVEGDRSVVDVATMLV